MDYKEKILKQIKTLTYGEAMTAITDQMKTIRGHWDSVVRHNGRYYRYDYERKHSYKEEYGKEVTGEDLKKYLALEDVYKGLSNGEIQAGKNKEIIL